MSCQGSSRHPRLTPNSGTSFIAPLRGLHFFQIWLMLNQIPFRGFIASLPHLESPWTASTSSGWLFPPSLKKATLLTVILLPGVAASNIWSLQECKGEVSLPHLRYPWGRMGSWQPRAPYRNEQGCYWTGTTAPLLLLPTLLTSFLPSYCTPACWIPPQSLQHTTCLTFSVLCYMLISQRGLLWMLYQW